MSGPWFTELENNHHYILVNERTGRSYYTPAQDDANEIAGILNRYDKTKNQEVFEIVRKLPEGEDVHVAFTRNFDLAYEFCEKHKDCMFYSINYAKASYHLESMYNNIPRCSNCIYFTDEHQKDEDSPMEQWCKKENETTLSDSICDDWKGDF